MVRKIKIKVALKWLEEQTVQVLPFIGLLHKNDLEAKNVTTAEVSLLHLWLWEDSHKHWVLSLWARLHKERRISFPLILPFTRAVTFQGHCGPSSPSIYSLHGTHSS